MSAITRASGRAIPVRGDDIDTDRIVPARFLKAITFDGLEAHLFEDDRAAGPHPLDDARYAGASIMIVGRNFGCGSSREHAPQAISRRGIRALAGESFSEIFFGNALALGLPCVSLSRRDVQRLMEAVEAEPALPVTVDLDRRQVIAGALRVAAVLPDAAREAFLSGAWDATGLLREHPNEVRATASRLPYLRGFDA